MPRILVALQDELTADVAVKALEKEGYEVTTMTEGLGHPPDPAVVAPKVAALEVQAAVFDYWPEDAASVKLLQALTDDRGAPEIIFVADPENKEGLEANHLGMLFNEGARGLLFRPLNAPALNNYIKRALKGPCRYRHEFTSDNREVLELEHLAAYLQSRTIRYEQLISFLLSRPMSAQRREVLIVSDSAYQRDLFKKHFADHNFHAIEAAGYQEALDSALRERPRIVISDYELGEKNGVDLCGALKFQQNLIPCYFVICTANQNKIEAALAPGNGVDDCLLKPGTTPEFTELIARATLGLLL